MRYRILFPLLTVIFAHIGLSQSSDTTTSHRRQAGDFTFNGLNLGGALGGHYWYDDEHFVRINLSTIFSSSLRDEPLDSNSFNQESQGIHFGFHVAWAAKLFSADRLVAYSGLSASITYDDDRQSSVRIGSTYSNRRISRGVGIGALVGFQYLLSETISLYGEKVVSGTWSLSSDKTRYFNFGNGNSSLILSMYF